MVPSNVSDAELNRLHAAGFRGVRYMMLGGLLPCDSLPLMAARIAPLNWNINLQLDGRDLPQHAAMIGKLPCKVVIDHTGKFLEVGVDADGSVTLLKLLDGDRVWVKLSAPYETSQTGAPDYEDVSILARALAHAHAQPDRCL